MSSEIENLFGLLVGFIKEVYLELFLFKQHDYCKKIDNKVTHFTKPNGETKVMVYKFNKIGIYILKEKVFLLLEGRICRDLLSN